MKGILLKNACFIDWQDLTFTDCHIKIENGEEGKIELLSPGIPIDESLFSEIMDCKGKVVTKSFAVGHHHVYSGLARGMPAPKQQPQNFHEKLKYIWWSLDKALDKESIKASALATAMACARDGVTFAIDHHASPNTISGSLEIIAEAFETVGIQHLLCYEVTDRDGKERAELGLNETKDYLKHHQALVGLHASFTVGQDTLLKAGKIMEEFDSGIHIHVAEDPIDQEITNKNYGTAVIERLDECGLLNSSKSILGHCLHLSDREKDIIAKSHAWVVQNMESNLNNKVGFFDGSKLGENIMLGTDGMHSDMIRSAQYAYFAGQKFDHIDMDIVYKRLRNVHSYLSQNEFKGDGPNNLIIIDYDGPTPLTEQNFLGHFIYGFHGGHVQYVISNGKFIVRDHRLVNIDEEAVLEFTKDQALRLWERMRRSGH